MTNSATLDLLDDEQRRVGSMHLDCLPGSADWRGIPTLEDRRNTPLSDAPGSPVRCLEEVSYEYRIDLLRGSLVRLEPAELFSASSAGLHRGRIQVGRATGTVRITAHLEDGTRAMCDVEVRSRKLNYESEYRGMLLRLAEEGAELVQSSFAASSLPTFAPDKDTPADTLYQRFAFVQSFIDSGLFDESLEILRNRPHSLLVEREEHVDPARGCKPGPALARQLTGPGERRSVAHSRSRLTSLPRFVVRVAHEETFDTIPNQFVRFAMEQWRALAEDVGDLLRGNEPAQVRGRQEAAYVAERLEHAMSIPALRDAGPLTQFPSSNTVLSSRSGYREFFRSYLLADIAASLDFDGGDDVFSAGQRDVAALYEYWAFLELARIVEELGFDVDRKSLLRVTNNRLSLELRRGKTSVLRASGVRRGRRVRLELWFNRSFSNESWTVPMRPDCSLLIAPDDPRNVGEETWLHFDAKYRIDQYTSFFVDDDDEVGGSTRVGSAKSDDLRKMHAYRDAIRKTSGAYVLYPGGDGDTHPPHQEYHEILPGLGAFVLRPTDSGEASSASSNTLRAFLSDVLDHTAAQGSGRERAGYWKRRSFGDNSESIVPLDFDPQLDKPPADTSVLLGFVKSPEHRAWIEEHRLYNLRSDPSRRGSVGIGSPQLRADVVVLYGMDSSEVMVYRATGALFLRSGDELAASGYPSPRGTNYLCLELGDRLDHLVNSEHVRALAGGSAEPVVRTWLDVAAG